MVRIIEYHILDDRLVTYPYTCTIYTKGLDYFRRNCTGMVMNLMFNTTAQDSIDIGDECETPGTLDAMNRNQFIILEKIEQAYTMVLIVDSHDTFTEDFCRHHQRIHPCWMINAMLVKIKSMTWIKYVRLLVKKHVKKLFQAHQHRFK